MKHFAIIVAGGSGKRMQSDLPKQFLLLKGLPIIMHSMLKFHHCRFQPEIILVLSKADRALWEQLVRKHQFEVPHRVVEGGKERYHSVKNALELIEEEALVAIHDAVRPLVSNKTIETAYEKAAISGSAVAAVPAKDSVRMIEGDKNSNIPRQLVYLVQTPQTFQSTLLKKAYRQPYNDNFTDDASVFEKAGFQVYLTEGDQFNFKITFPEDLRLAETILEMHKHSED